MADLGDILARLEAAEAQLRALSALPRDQDSLRLDSPQDPRKPRKPIPVYDVATDGLINHELNRGFLSLWLSKDQMQKEMAAAPGGGGGGGGLIGVCDDMWNMYDLTCVNRPGLAPLMLRFDRNMTTCQLRVRGFDFCCVTCAEVSGGSSGVYDDLDRWVNCNADSGNEQYVYLHPEIRTGFGASAVIQLDGAGYCYELDATGVTETATTFTSIATLTCDDSDCATPAPCTCPGNVFAGLTVSGLNGGSFAATGSMSQDGGGGCANCSAPFSGQTVWNGTGFSSYDSGSCSIGHPGPIYINRTANDTSAQLAMSSCRIGLDASGCRWYFGVVFDCDGSKQLIWLKETGDTPAGTYTLAPYGAGSFDCSSQLEGCFTPLATVTVS